MDKKEIEKTASQLVESIEHGDSNGVAAALYKSISSQDRHALAQEMDRINQANRKTNSGLPDIRFTTTQSGGQARLLKIVVRDREGHSKDVFHDQDEEEKPAMRFDWNDGNLTGVSDAGRKEKLKLHHDEFGTQSVVLDGKLVLERVTRPREKNGECLWLINQHNQVRGSIHIQPNGLPTFELSNGDRYRFNDSGDVELQSKEPDLDRTITPDTLLNWLHSNMLLLDTDKSNSVSTDELWAKGRQTNSATEASTIAALISLSKWTYNDLTMDTLAKLLAEPNTKKHIEDLLKICSERAQSTDQRLWGDFEKHPLDAISPEAIHQGSLGDCWLLGSIASLAETNPALIEKMIKANADGSYTVKFPGNAEAVTVSAPTPIELAFYAQAKQYGSWVAVLEKAAAVVFSRRNNPDDRQSLDGGYGDVALKLLTGNRTINWRSDLPDENPELCTKAANLEHLASMLAVAQEWHQPVVAGTRSDAGSDGSTLYGMHLYTVLAYDPSTKMVTIRNPWGRGEPENTDSRAKDGKTDGTFTLSLESFARNCRVVSCTVPS